ncbi:MAG: HAMP domain-containing histidine kinase [Proteobacteria bacterium]|nr:HAMP domain-containing histidine kinase [Pseudomonadota bacterium]
MGEPSIKAPAEMTPPASLEEVLSTLRHQLGNSVNALKVTLDVLQENFDHFDEEKRREYLRRALEILERQQAMVEAMKAYSSINVKELSAIPFVPLWNDFLKMVSLRLEKEKVRLIHDADVEPCLIKGNPMAIHRAMTEILDNALEALEGVSNPAIGLEVSKSRGGLMIIMRDNGCGIKKGELAKIFVPLFTTKPKKRGIGLPVALKLLTQMGGRLEIENLLSGGTQAMVWLRTVTGGEDE